MTSRKQDRRRAAGFTEELFRGFGNEPGGSKAPVVNPLQIHDMRSHGLSGQVASACDLVRHLDGLLLTQEP
ncbi:hypothetical protein, partial [Mycobacteroides abscessus]|uniref:hypothetical protein n=1 Tax=Mycobacteroides abscessus TaxID=36809 RepID=UPI001A974DE5